MIAFKKRFYGTTTAGGLYGAGTVYDVDRAGHEHVLYNFTGGLDGSTPHAGLIWLDGLLYGTTMAGGASGNGTVFSVNPKTRVESVLYSFSGGVDGGPRHSVS